MNLDAISAAAAVMEATRPKRSGVAKNAYAVRSKKEPEPDFAKMKEAIEGGRFDQSDKTDEPAKE